MWNDLIALVREWGVFIGLIVGGTISVILAAHYTTLTNRKLPKYIAKILVGMGLTAFVLGVIGFVLNYLFLKGLL